MELAQAFMDAMGVVWRPGFSKGCMIFEVLLDALRRAPSLDKKAINRALEETDALPTTCGDVTFDGDHAFKSPVCPGQWQYNATAKYKWEYQVVYSPVYPEIATTAPLLYPLPPP